MENYSVWIQNLCDILFYVLYFHHPSTIHHSLFLSLPLPPGSVLSPHGSLLSILFRFSFVFHSLEAKRKFNMEKCIFFWYQIFGNTKAHKKVTNEGKKNRFLEKKKMFAWFSALDVVRRQRQRIYLILDWSNNQNRTIGSNIGGAVRRLLSLCISWVHI